MEEIKKGRWRGKCKMCGGYKDLCNAHLLPDSLKKIAEDWKKSNPQIFQITIEDDPRKSITQTLWSDTKILCSDCDARLGLFDKNLKELLVRWTEFDQRRLHFKVRESFKAVDFPAKYDHLFLGGLASLLRFSMSDRHPEIGLGDRYEKLVADYLQSVFTRSNAVVDISETVQLRVLGAPSRFLGDEVDITRVMKARPDPLRIGRAYVYVMELFGLTLFYKIGRSDWPSALSALPPLKKDENTICIRLIDFERTFMGMDIGKMFGRVP